MLTGFQRVHSLRSIVSCHLFRTNKISQCSSHSMDTYMRKTNTNEPDMFDRADSNMTTVRQTLADHVAAYFSLRFDSDTIGIEMSYNLRDACLRYRHCEQINLFWGIITGQIEELVYHHRMKSIGQLLQYLIRTTSMAPFNVEHMSTSTAARQAIVSEPNSPLTLTNRQSSLFASSQSHEEIFGRYDRLDRYIP
jgi:hypothetical protein